MARILLRSFHLNLRKSKCILRSIWYSALLHVCEKISETRGDHLVPTERDVISHLEMSLTCINLYPTAFPYGNGMVLHFYQQQDSSTTKTVHKIINKGLKAYV